MKSGKWKVTGNEKRVDESPLVFLLDDRPQTMDGRFSIVLYNVSTMLKPLMRLWRLLPMWVHVFVTRLTQPKFNAGVSSLIFDERGRVLLFKHTYRKFEWGIPGGALEYKEQPIEAVVREFHEETGMQIEVIRLLRIASAREFPHLGVTYLCKITGGEFKPSHEISEMKYFNLNDLPIMLFAEKDLIRWAVKELEKN
ncbi:MAG: NUDIX domain-containing protein [Chloroflexi bacterium]|nr:NUDIX domain-containing protein [Chloroflexota bacterium]